MRNTRSTSKSAGLLPDLTPHFGHPPMTLTYNLSRTPSLDIKAPIHPPNSTADSPTSINIPLSPSSPTKKVKRVPKAPLGPTRFPPTNTHGDRQCTNCAETTTAQWRGTLCNACALWKRSRGTDRPLPLRFPRKESNTTEHASDESDKEECRVCAAVAEEGGLCRECRVRAGVPRNILVGSTHIQHRQLILQPTHRYKPYPHRSNPSTDSIRSFHSHHSIPRGPPISNERGAPAVEDPPSSPSPSTSPLPHPAGFRPRWWREREVPPPQVQEERVRVGKEEFLRACEVVWEVVHRAQGLAGEFSRGDAGRR